MVLLLVTLAQGSIVHWDGSRFIIIRIVVVSVTPPFDVVVIVDWCNNVDHIVSARIHRRAIVGTNQIFQLYGICINRQLQRRHVHDGIVVFLDGIFTVNDDVPNDVLWMNLGGCDASLFFDGACALFDNQRNWHVVTRQCDIPRLVTAQRQVVMDVLEMPQVFVSLPKGCSDLAIWFARKPLFGIDDGDRGLRSADAAACKHKQHGKCRPRGDASPVAIHAVL
mmetsp:Transcript_18356/g.52446  ORF Transcript_18356/g.52446 Transcript_18356/m.52446 type:complete len:223 (-) Transcript_18356:282-950(-)